MLSVGNTKFAASNQELTESLFNKGGTANGVYKIVNYGICFYTPQRELFAALIKNNGQNPFFVSASIKNGKKWFMQCLMSKDKIRLGIGDFGYMQEMNEAERIVNDILTFYNGNWPK